MHQPMSLEELKSEAQKRNHLVIRREGETAWRPLKNWKGDPIKNWKGDPTGTVVYYLIGNKVVVRAGHEKDEHCYVLS